MGSEYCGFAWFRPKWLQRFKGPKMFLFDFSIVALIRASYFTYLISVMTTIEKRYAFPGKIFAFVLIMDNLSGMIMSPVIGLVDLPPLFASFLTQSQSLSCLTQIYRQEISSTLCYRLRYADGHPELLFVWLTLLHLWSGYSSTGF